MLPSCFLPSVFFVVPWCGAGHVCVQKRHGKGFLCGQSWFLGSVWRRSLGVQATFQLGSCVWRRTREAHSPEVGVRRSISPGDRDGGVSWCLPCWGAISTAPQTPSLLLLCLEPELWLLAEEKCKARVPWLALGSESSSPPPPPPVPVPPLPPAETLNRVQGVLQAVSEPAF